MAIEWFLAESPSHSSVAIISSQARKCRVSIIWMQVTIQFVHLALIVYSINSADAAMNM